MRLNQVTLTSTDVARGRDFYLRLGFTLIVDSAPRYVRLEAPSGGATLSLHVAADGVAVPVEGGAVVYLECEDAATLDATVTRLEASGVVFAQQPRDESWLWREARLRDPDGNELCLYFAGENRLQPPWRVKP